MAGSVNKVILLGNVGRDPEIRRTQDGKPIANFSLATSQTWKDADGERHEKTHWHSCVCFNEKLTEVIEKYVRKGSKLYVEGSLQTRKWQDNSGNDRYSTEVVLQAFNGNIVLLDGKDGSGFKKADSVDDYGSESRSNGHSESKGGNAMGGGTGAFNDEIPF